MISSQKQQWLGWHLLSTNASLHVPSTSAHWYVHPSCWQNTYSQGIEVVVSDVDVEPVVDDSDVVVE
jgi:hypothetical protein